MTPPCRILLVEDDSDDQLFFTEALNEIENTALYDVARNGEEALQILAKSDLLPTMIFMDVNMPVMNGEECLKQIMKNPLTKEIPVVFLSTETQKSATLQSLGARGFITKSNDGTSLRSDMEKIINHNYLPVPLSEVSNMGMM